MRDPGLAQLEMTLTYYCDTLLDSDVVLEGDDVVLSAHWYYSGGEFRVHLVVPPGQRIAPVSWLRWRLGGQQFRHLPSRPTFEWYSPIGWQQAFTLAQWRRVLDATGGTAPGGAHGEFGSRPVRPRFGPPALDAGAAAVPDVLPWEEEFAPALSLHDRRQLMSEDVR